MAYPRLRKFNMDETKRALDWKTEWFRAMLPGTYTAAQSEGFDTSCVAETVGHVVDGMVMMVYGLYRFFPEIPGDDGLPDTMNAVRVYVMKESDGLLRSPSYMQRMRSMVYSLVASAWGVFCSEYRLSERPVNPVPLALLPEDRDGFVSESVLYGLRDITEPAVNWETFRSQIDAVLLTVNDALVRRNREKSGPYQAPWMLLQFPEPCDLAVMMLRTGAGNIPDFMERLTQEPWFVGLCKKDRKEYLSWLDRELERNRLSCITA